MGFNRKIRQKTIEKSKVNLVSVVYNRGKKCFVLLKRENMFMIGFSWLKGFMPNSLIGKSEA